MLTSIVKKTAMAVTGLAWFLFLVGHLVGNLKLFQGEQSFNHYAELLESTGPLLYLAEIGLIAFLAAHIYSAIRVSLENRAARPRDYEVQKDRGRKTVYSRSMLVGGVIVLVFLVTHIWMFKFGDRSIDGGLYGVVVSWFKNPLIVAWYILAMVAVGMHLSHGLGSAFQTLGVSQSAWRVRLRNAGVILGWVIAGGFIVLPIWTFIAA